jgi:hypothetical protein
MAIRNYRQAKRNREDTRKKRQQEKLERKQNRGTSAPETDPAQTPAVETEPKEPT